MTLERLLSEIELRARSELEAEERRAAGAASKILEDSERSASQLKAESERATQAEAGRLRSQVLASAKLQARRMEYEAREQRLSSALGDVRRILAEYTQSAEYPALLKRLYAHAVERLGKGIKIAGRSEDATLLKAVAGRSVLVQPIPILGGIVAQTPDGTRRLSLTFDELLRMRDDALRELLMAD